MEPLKASVSGGVKYPLKPVTPGDQDAALTEVKRPGAGLGPLKALEYARTRSGRVCAVRHKFTDGNLVYWQINDRVNEEKDGKRPADIFKTSLWL